MALRFEYVISYLRAPVPAGLAALLEVFSGLTGAFTPTIEGLLPKESFPSFPASLAGARDARLLS